MTYTPSGLKAKSTVSNFGGLSPDANRVVMTGAVGNTFQTIDATGSPQSSPLTVNTTSTLVVPLNAVSVLISSVTNAVQVSEDSTQGAFFLVPAASPQWFDCARQQNIYLKTGSSTSVNFCFKCV